MMRFVISVLFLFIVVESSQSKKYLVLLRHDKNDGIFENILESRKSQLGKAAIAAYFRTEPGRFLRSCLRQCDDSNLKPGFECIQECKMQCRQIKHTDNKNVNKNEDKNNAAEVLDITPDIQMKLFHEAKCEKNDYFCLYLSLVESNEAKNAKGDLLTLIAGDKHTNVAERKKRPLKKKKYYFRKHSLYEHLLKL